MYKQGQSAELPFLKTIICFIGGIIFSVYVMHSLKIWLITGISLGILTGLYLAITRFYHIHRYTSIASLLIQVLFFICGVVITDWHTEIKRKDHFSHYKTDFLTIIITEQPKIKGDIARFNADVKEGIYQKSTQKLSGQLLVAMRFDTSRFFPYRYGDQLLIKSKYTEIEPPYNPAEFNYKKFLSYKQIYHQSFIHQKQSYLLAHNQANHLIAFAQNCQYNFVRRFEKHLKFKDSQAVASTLILGYRAQLDQDILQSYSRTGTLHVLSVSGMHVVILVSIIGFILSFLKRFRSGKTISLALLLIIIWSYWLITGAAPSITRAAIMMSLVLISKNQRYTVKTLNILAFSAFLILIDNPYNLMDVGFQLSFLAVLGLIELHPKIHRCYYSKSRLKIAIWDIASVSISAQTATFIISIYYFHQFPLYFILSNIFIYIPSFLIMAFGFAFLTLGYLPLLTAPLAFLLDYSIYFTNRGLHFIEYFPYASIGQIWFSKYEITLLLLAFAVFLFQARKSILKIAFLLLLAAGVHSYFTLGHMNQRKVLFYSLRKNQAVAFLDGRHATLLTDLDSNSSTFNFSIKPYLDSCRIQHIKWIRLNQEDGEKIIHFKPARLKIIHQQQAAFSPSDVDFLLLSYVKKFDVGLFLKHNRAKYYFIDAGTKDYIAKELAALFRTNAKKLYILKRRKAREFNLKSEK